MGFRIRDNSNQLFQLFAEVVGPSDTEAGWILQKFPDEFVDEGILRSIPLFCFPTGKWISGPVQQFSFVLTDVKGIFTFGFCRTNTDGKTCLCILSHLPWHDLFYKLLNYIGDVMKMNPSDDFLGFLRSAYRAEVPHDGDMLHIIYKIQKIEFQCPTPDLKKLPSIPGNRAVTEYFNALDLPNMITVFASLLNERRIIVTSKKLGRLSACVMACEILLFPLHWQHIFVTVLPKKLLEHVTAPMPYIIGIPGDLMPMVLQMDLGEVVLVDADNNKVTTPFDDTRDIPASVISIIKTASGKMFGDGVARAFMRALVMLIGGYRFGLCMPPGEKISFDMKKFIKSRPAALQVFLSKLAELQIFRQFIEERLDTLNTGDGFSDEFEAEVSLLIDHESEANRDVSIADQYRRWTSKGGNLFRNMTNKMKDRSKDAVKGLKDRMTDLNVKDTYGTDRVFENQFSLSSSLPDSFAHSSNLTVPGLVRDDQMSLRSSRAERDLVTLSVSTNTSSGSSDFTERVLDEDGLVRADFSGLPTKQGNTHPDAEEPALINLDTDLTCSSNSFHDILKFFEDSVIAVGPNLAVPHQPAVSASAIQQRLPFQGSTLQTGTTLQPNWGFRNPGSLPVMRAAYHQPLYPMSTNATGNSQWYPNPVAAINLRASINNRSQQSTGKDNQQAGSKELGRTDGWTNFE